MSKITSEYLDYICDALVKAFTVDRHIAVEPDAINEIRRLARLGLWAEEHGIPTIKIYTGENGENLPRRIAISALSALPKEAQ